jgi:hypothetical protein
MAPKPDNPGQAIRDLVQLTQTDTPAGDNLGQAIHDALGGVEHSNAAVEKLGQLVKDQVQSYDNAEHDLGQHLSDYIHTQHDSVF